MSPRARPVAQRIAARSLADELQIPAEHLDRAAALTQIASLLVSHPRMAGALVFKGGAIMTTVDGSPRFSRDLDSVSIIGDAHATKMIKAAWIDEALSTPAARRIVRYSTPALSTRTKSLYVPIITCHSLTGGPPINISLSVTWREKLCLPPVVVTVTNEATGATYKIRVMQAIERCAEKVRAFLERRLPRDAYDLYYYLQAVLTPSDVARLQPLIATKLEASDPRVLVTGLDLERECQTACGTAALDYPADVVLRGPAPTWPEVQVELDRLAGVLRGLVAP